MESEKPTKPQHVAVGQRWQHELSTGPRTVELFDRGTATFDTGSIGFEGTMLKDPRWTYLGGPTPPVPSPPIETPVMGADKDGFPLGCLQCGKTPLTEDEAYECEGCPIDGYSKRVDAWMAGARDFPRTPRPAPGEATTTVVDPRLQTEKRPGVVQYEKLPPEFYGPSISDMLSAAAPKPAPITRREVSVDGRNWTDYDRLTDGDAFEAYPWRRWQDAGGSPWRP